MFMTSVRECSKKAHGNQLVEKDKFSKETIWKKLGKELGKFLIKPCKNISSFIFLSDLNGSYSRIKWIIKIDIKIIKEKRLVKHRLIDLCWNSMLSCCKFLQDEFCSILKAVETTQVKINWIIKVMDNPASFRTAS